VSRSSLRNRIPTTSALLSLTSHLRYSSHMSSLRRNSEIHPEMMMMMLMMMLMMMR
jgi:hypothetical protein